MIRMTRILGILFIFGFLHSDRRLLIRLNQDLQDSRIFRIGVSPIVLPILDSIL